MAQNIKHARLYNHMLDGWFGVLLGGSAVLAFDDNGVGVGFAPEAGLGFGTSLKVFYRYNIYLDDKYNSHEVVFHLRKSRSVW